MPRSPRGITARSRSSSSPSPTTRPPSRCSASCSVLYFILPYWEVSAGEALWCFRHMARDNALSYPKGGSRAIPRDVRPPRAGEGSAGSPRHRRPPRSGAGRPRHRRRAHRRHRDPCHHRRLDVERAHHREPARRRGALPDPYVARAMANPRLVHRGAGEDRAHQEARFTRAASWGGVGEGNRPRTRRQPAT